MLFEDDGSIEASWYFALRRKQPRPELPPQQQQGFFGGLHWRAMQEIQAQEDARVFAILDEIAGPPPPPTPPPPTRLERIFTENLAC